MTWGHGCFSDKPRKFLANQDNFVILVLQLNGVVYMRNSFGNQWAEFCLLNEAIITHNKFIRSIEFHL